MPLLLPSPSVCQGSLGMCTRLIVPSHCMYQGSSFPAIEQTPDNTSEGKRSRGKPLTSPTGGRVCDGGEDTAPPESRCHGLLIAKLGDRHLLQISSSAAYTLDMWGMSDIPVHGRFPSSSPSFFLPRTSSSWGGQDVSPAAASVTFKNKPFDVLGRGTAGVCRWSAQENSAH